VRAHRIASEKYARSALDAFSGVGSLYGDGRWHHQGRLAVYVAQYESLAMLEVLVHLRRVAAIQPYMKWEIEIPDPLIQTPALPAGWETDIEVSRSFGDAWLDGRTGIALRVPSIMVPREANLLLNPAHPDFHFENWIVAGPLPVVFDPRLLARAR
jgi:RES domain-containing protein